MTPKEKSKFEELAKNDKIRYDQEMKSYVPPKGSKASKKKKKDPNAPKRPPWVLVICKAETRWFFICSHICCLSPQVLPSSCFVRTTDPRSRRTILASLLVTLQKSLENCGQHRVLKTRHHMKPRQLSWRRNMRRYCFRIWCWVCIRLHNPKLKCDCLVCFLGCCSLQSQRWYGQEWCW